MPVLNTMDFYNLKWKSLLHKLRGERANTHMGLDMRKPVFDVCEQQKRKLSCASGQFDQRLCYSLFGKYHI